MNRLIIIVTSLFLVLPFSAQKLYAQEEIDVVVPGSSLVDGSLIKPHVDTLQTLMVLPDGSESQMSQLVRSIEATDHDGTPTWTIVQSHKSESESRVDTSVVSRRDLAPLQYTLLEEGVRHRWTFDEGFLIGWVQSPDGRVGNSNYQLNTPPFNALVEIDVIRALPLEEGLELLIPNFQASPSRTRVRVTRSEVVSTKSGAIEAWVVVHEADEELTTLWIAKDDRRFLRSRTELGDLGTMWEIPVADLDAWRADR